MTIEEANKLCVGQILIDIHNNKWKILSIKKWKKNPEKILLSCKHGLWEFARFDETRLHLIKDKQERYY